MVDVNIFLSTTLFITYIIPPSDAGYCLDVQEHNQCPFFDDGTCHNLSRDHYSCQEKERYHCAWSYSDNRFIEACVTPTKCGLGQEPILFHDGKRNLFIRCEKCRESNRFNPQNDTWSNDISECPKTKSRCYQSENKVICDYDNELDRYSQNIKCRCDLRNGYRIAYEYNANESACTLDVGFDCMKAKCYPEYDLSLLGYRCLPKCPAGFSRTDERSDECIPDKSTTTVNTGMVSPGTPGQPVTEQLTSQATAATPKPTVPTTFATVTTSSTPKTTATQIPEIEDSDGKIGAKTLTGIIVGSVLGGAGLVLLCICIYRRYKQTPADAFRVRFRRNQHEPQAQEGPTEQAGLLNETTEPQAQEGPTEQADQVDETTEPQAQEGPTEQADQVDETTGNATPPPQAQGGSDESADPVDERAGNATPPPQAQGGPNEPANQPANQAAERTDLDDDQKRDLQRKVIKRIFSKFVEDFQEPDRLLDLLIDSFDGVTIRNIREKPNTSEKNRAILDKMKSAPWETYCKFKESLREIRPHNFAEDLEAEEIQYIPVLQAGEMTPMPAEPKQPSTAHELKKETDDTLVQSQVYTMAEVMKSVCAVIGPRHGTGFRVADRYIFTAYHVIRDSVEGEKKNARSSDGTGPTHDYKSLTVNTLDITSCCSERIPTGPPWVFHHFR